MKKFEYEIRTVLEHEDFLKKLNEWGKEGWELISFEKGSRRTRPPANSQCLEPINIYFIDCILKREKQCL